MKKVRNRRQAFKADHSLPRSKILRGKRDFQQLFESSAVLRSRSLMFICRIYSEPSKGVRVGFSAPRKTFRKATDRNRMKRKMREAYRIRQHFIKEAVTADSVGIHGLFILKKEITYSDLGVEMQYLLQEAVKLIQKS